MSNTLQFFAYAHLPPHLQAVSKPFADAARVLNLGSLQRLAASLADTLPTNTQGDLAMQCVAFASTLLDRNEHELALRMTLQAKDCAVRSLLEKDGDFTIDESGKAVAITP